MIQLDLQGPHTHTEVVVPGVELVSSLSRTATASLEVVGTGTYKVSSYSGGGTSVFVQEVRAVHLGGDSDDGLLVVVVSTLCLTLPAGRFLSKVSSFYSGGTSASRVGYGLGGGSHRPTDGGPFAHGPLDMIDPLRSTALLSQTLYGHSDHRLGLFLSQSGG